MVKQLLVKKHKWAVTPDEMGSWWVERAGESQRGCPDFDIDSPGAINKNIEGRRRSQNGSDEHKLNFPNCFHYISSTMDRIVSMPDPTKKTLKS